MARSVITDATKSVGCNDSGWARLANIIRWISYVAGAIAIVFTLFVTIYPSSHPEWRERLLLFGWGLAAFFIGGAGIISELWKDKQGGVKTFSDFMHWLTGGWAIGQLCSIAVALFIVYKYRPEGVNIDMKITAGIGAVVGFLPLAIVAGIAWVGRGFRRRS